MSSEEQEQSADYKLSNLQNVIASADSVRGNLIDSLPIWLSAQTTKSAGRGRSAENTHQYGVQKLRELILELAVRGKLVEQDSNDEPASVLLDNVDKEKTRLFKSGDIKKPRKLPAASENDMPYSLPNGWEWTQIENIGHDWGQETPSEDFTYIDVASIDNAKGVISKPSVLSSSDAPSRARKIVKTNTLIYSTIRPYLQNIAVIIEDIEPKPIASTAFAVIHPLLGMSAKYFLHYFRSPTFVKYVESVQAGIAYPAINDKQFFAGLVPIPPLAEQHRIVKKVDELMALCDKLEQQQADAVQAHDTLVNVLLDTLTKSDNADDFQQNWRRIAEHFDTLFTTESSIDQLKQTLLQLAVMGKLVPQDPNDEPASILITRVQKYLKQQASSKQLPKLKRDKSVFEPDDFQYSVPSTWQWVELQDIFLFTNGKAHEQFVNENGKYVLINSKFVSNSGQIRKYVTERLTPLETGDISLVMSDVPNGRALARCYLIEENNIYTLNQRIGGLKTSPELDRNYLLIALDRHRYMLAYNDGQKQTNLKKVQIMSAPVPLPPLAEQHRIVKKVDELMALCDQLKDRLNQAQTLQQQLADAVVAQSVE
jgi:type I restriction enzyme S subunit